MDNGKKFFYLYRNLVSFSWCFMKLSLAVWWSTIVTFCFWNEYKTAILISTKALSFHNDVGFRVSNPILMAIGYIDSWWSKKNKKKCYLKSFETFKELFIGFCFVCLLYDSREFKIAPHLPPINSFCWCHKSFDSQFQLTYTSR